MPLMLTTIKRRLHALLVGYDNGPTDQAIARWSRVSPSYRTDEPLPASTGLSMLEATRRAAEAAKNTDEPFDQTTAALLLRRDTPKTESANDLIAAPVERALDSILADEVVTHMPPAIRAPFDILAAQVHTLLLTMESTRRDAWLKSLASELRREEPRPWSPKEAILTQLSNADDGQRFELLTAYWHTPSQNGFQVMATMSIVRGLYMSAQALGIGPSTVPFANAATNDYALRYLPQTGRMPYSSDSTQADLQHVAGITMLGAPPAIDPSWMVAGPRTLSRHQPDLRNTCVRKALQFGNGYGVGVSGSTLVMLYAVEHYQKQGVQGLYALDLIIGMAAMLCYNGGHTLHEALDAARQFSNDRLKDQLACLHNYRPGQARAFFIEHVRCENVLRRSLRRLAAYVLLYDVDAIAV